MLQINKNGLIESPKVHLTYIPANKKAAKTTISPLIQQGEMTAVNGIIVHQTDNTSEISTMDTYHRELKKGKPNGAHLLIAFDGTIYQTAPLNRRAAHVGAYKPRCLYDYKCDPVELKLQKDKFVKKWDPVGENDHEKVKNFPDRFPGNPDSIGIEIVGKAYPKLDKDGKKIKDSRGNDVMIFEGLRDAQKKSLKWLLLELTDTLKVPFTEVYRHPIVSHKNETEALDAEDTIKEAEAEAKSKEEEAKKPEEATQ